MKLPKGYVPGYGVHKATAMGGYGQKMLERMGWEKGLGLGKNKDGMTDAIEVKEKKDTLGVGANQSWDWSVKFWEEAYNVAVKNIDHDTDSPSNSDASTSSSSSSSSSSSGSDSDSDSDSDSGLSPAGAKRAKRTHRDGTHASGASVDELKLAAELAKDPWGRWGGKAGKMARIRQQEELEAAKARERLGLAPATTSSKAAVAGAGGKAEATSSVSDSDAVELGVGLGGKGGSKAGKRKADGKGEKKEEKKHKSKGSGEAAAGAEQQQQQKQQVPAPARERIVITLKVKEDPSIKRSTFIATPLEGWWGAKYFVTAGVLEGLEEAAEHVSRERKEFNEKDQEALYMQAHDHQRQGRKGLGKSTTLKIAGGKWEGTKTTFEDEGGDTAGPGPGSGQPEDQQDSEGGGCERTAGAGSGKKQRKSKKQQKAEQQQQGNDSGGEEDGKGSDGKKVKWLKLVKALLKKAPERRMKLKAVARRLVEEGCGKKVCGASYSHKEVRQIVLDKANKAKRMSVDGKFVVLS